VLQLVDTAGLRDNPTDLVEELGIERTRQQAEQASLIVLVLDANDPLPELLETSCEAGILAEFLALCSSRQAIIVSNKHDLLQTTPSKASQELAARVGDVPILEVSLLNAEDQLRVLQAISAAAKQVSGDFQGVFSLTRRQTEALSRCRQCLFEVEQTLSNGLSAEFVALDLRQAIFLLGEIQGINVTEEVLDRIFSTFCLGK
jgi:tRNA modification GTPase